MSEDIELVVLKHPSACNPNEIKDFAALVLHGGEVAEAGLEARINCAEALCFLYRSGSLKGVAALKHPDDRYKESIFSKARASIELSVVKFELGWVYVLPPARGQGLSRKLVETALRASDGKPVFATSRSDNEPMHRVLRANGFCLHGEQYVSNRGGYRLMLFVSGK